MRPPLPAKVGTNFAEKRRSHGRTKATEFRSFPVLCMLGHIMGHATAQAVSLRLPTAEARVRIQVSHVAFVVDKVALGQVFSSHSSTYILRGWYNRPISGRRTKWTQSQPIQKKKRKKEPYRISPPAGRGLVCLSWRL
jgi:anti-sigma factor RsiW